MHGAPCHRLRFHRPTLRGARIRTGVGPRLSPTLPTTASWATSSRPSTPRPKPTLPPFSSAHSVMVGNCFGRDSYAIAEADLTCASAERAARGRDEPLGVRARAPVKSADFCASPTPTGSRSALTPGSSRCQGFVWAVRDAVIKAVAVKEKGKPTGDFTDEVIDEGVSDKRRLWLETEFASVVKAGDREKNMLSAKARDCWDGIDLRTAAKNV